MNHDVNKLYQDKITAEFDKGREGRTKEGCFNFNTWDNYLNG